MKRIVFDQQTLQVRVVIFVILAAIGALASIPGASLWVTIFIAAALLSPLLRYRLVLEPTLGRWIREGGIGPLVLRKTGSFDELKSIRITYAQVRREDRGDELRYAADLVWQDGRPPMRLFEGANLRHVAEWSADLGRVIGVRVTETDKLKTFRSQFRDLPMLD